MALVPRLEWASVTTDAAESWQTSCLAVVEAMAQAVEPSITPISRPVAVEAGELVGTGTYVRLLGQPYLLTNEHVARFLPVSGLAHLPKRGGDYHRIATPFQCVSRPLDAALVRIDESTFQIGDRQCVPPECVAKCSETPQHELLFVLGFPGELSRMSAFADGLLTRAVPYLTQQAPLPTAYDSSTSFALHYPYDKPLTMSDGKTSILPDPHGLSGSAVWATGVIATGGKTWSPSQARIVGLVHSWDLNNHTLVATKIEFIREFLVHALRRESAYFSWLQRGQPLGDDWSDWFNAETFIQDLR